MNTDVLVLSVEGREKQQEKRTRENMDDRTHRQDSKTLSKGLYITEESYYLK